MEKQQIKDLIAQNINGQGNQVDISGKLAAILDAIVDEIPEGGESIPVLEVTPFALGEVTTEEELFSKIKLNGQNITSLQQLENLGDKVFYIKQYSNSRKYMILLNSISNTDIVFVAGYSYGSPSGDVYEIIDCDINRNSIGSSYINFDEA